MNPSLLKRIAGLCVIASLFCSSIAAHAWGYDGHRIAAEVASDLLTPKARVRLGELLPGVALADIASYMDEERMALKRQVPGSDKWHYDNIPVCGKATPAQTCPNGNCATARIEQLSSVLADRSTDQATRVFAVKALVHLIADIHQPLHSADEHDHGGNDIAVGSRNLHSEWDTGLVKKLTRGQSTDAYAKGLLVRYRSRLAGAQAGNAAAWAGEAHDLAVRVAYGALPGFACGQRTPSFDRLPATYYDAALPVVESQLAMAGARIAFVLNRALSGERPTSTTSFRFPQAGDQGYADHHGNQHGNHDTARGYTHALTSLVKHSLRF